MISKDEGHRHCKRGLGIDGKTDCDERETYTTAQGSEEHEWFASKTIDEKRHDGTEEHQRDEIDAGKDQGKPWAEAE